MRAAGIDEARQLCRGSRERSSNAGSLHSGEIGLSAGRPVFGAKTTDKTQSPVRRRTGQLATRLECSDQCPRRHGARGCGVERSRESEMGSCFSKQQKKGKRRRVIS